MPNARLGNYVFDIDPSSASWGYSLNVSRQETYGGYVLQILSRKVDDLVISGYIPLRGGDRMVQFAEMERFENDMMAIMSAQSGDPPRSITFSYPELNWEGQVFLMGYDSVTYDVQTSAARYTLRFAVDTGFEGITNIAGIDGIDNIPDGVNWVRNRYNTPSSSYKYEEIMEAIGKILDDIGQFDVNDPPTLYQKLGELAEDKKKREEKAADDVVVAKAESILNKVTSGSAALFDAAAPKTIAGQVTAAAAKGLANILEEKYAKWGK